MNKLIYTILIVVIAFTSCDGRKSKKLALADSINTFKKTNTIEISNYIPESYRETTLDTTFDSKFRLKLKTFTDLDHSVLKEIIKDTIHYKKHYRQLKSTIEISYNNKVIYKRTLSNANLNNLLKLNKANFNSKIIQGVWLNNENTTTKLIALDFSICEPELENCSDFRLSINKYGEEKLITL